nr:peptidoglycan DD-metalloendopeptidase family protein [Aridibaculum aurantiacum]
MGSGYNHKGTDMYLWPFAWKKMSNGAVEVVAAAAGTIVGKMNGNYDLNCAFCTSSCQWNAVYIIHDDGSVAWYGHLKNNSLTSKPIGTTVAAGEYLGVVGSSGNSTGPHLHLEIYTNTNYDQLVDPYGGNCNSMNGTTSWWQNQEPYRVSTLNKIMTHGAAPLLGSCPANEVVNEQVNFVNSQTVYLGSYYRDQQNMQQTVHTILRPDNTVYQTWTQTAATTYNFSYWYYSIVLPGAAPSGVWKYKVNYNGTEQVTDFAVNTILPLQLISFNATRQGSVVKLDVSTQHETNVSHFNLLRSADGRNYNSVGKLAARNEVANHYNWRDEKPVAGTNYYKLEMVDKDGIIKHSDVRQVKMIMEGMFTSVAGNPFIKSISLQVKERLKDAQLQLVNMNGQVVWQKDRLQLQQGYIQIDAASLARGVYQLIVRVRNEVVDRHTVVKQ